MKRYLLVLLFLAVLFGCKKQETDPETGEPEVAASVKIEAGTVADHDLIVATPCNAGSSVVILLAETTDVKAAVAVPSVNKKVTEQCLLEGYTLCIVGISSSDNPDFIKEIKIEFPNASKFYLLGYLKGGSLAYAAAMKYPGEFKAFGSVNGPIDYATYSKTDFTVPVNFIHVHGTANTVYMWNGKDKEYAGAALSVGAAVAAAKCVHYETGSYLARDGYEKVTYTHYIGSSHGKDVMFYQVPGGKNDWCDSNFEVYNAIWQFFNKH